MESEMASWYRHEPCSGAFFYLYIAHYQGNATYDLLLLRSCIRFALNCCRSAAKMRAQYAESRLHSSSEAKLELTSRTRTRIPFVLVYTRDVI